MRKKQPLSCFVPQSRNSLSDSRDHGDISIFVIYFLNKIDSSRRRAPAAADTESIEGTFFKPGPTARVSSQLQCSARIELPPPRRKPHSERGATQEPHSTPAQNTEAVYRAPLLVVPPSEPGPDARGAPALPSWAVDCCLG